MVDLMFLPYIFGLVVRTFQGLLPFCECTRGGSSIYRWWGHLSTKGVRCARGDKACKRADSCKEG